MGPTPEELVQDTSNNVYNLKQALAVLTDALEALLQKVEALEERVSKLESDTVMIRPIGPIGGRTLLND